MKKLILISLFTSTIAFSQVPKLELTSKGIEPVIINVDMKQASAIYAKTIEWLENSYEKPDDVIFENVENRYRKDDCRDQKGKARPLWSYTCYCLELSRGG